jgi:uncharacterized RDD family membrane protein YckC
VELPKGTAYQGLGRRFLAQAADWALLFTVLSIYEAVLGPAAIVLAFLGPTLVFNYFLVCEWLWGRTPGKGLMLIRVTSEHGRRLTWNEAAIRNLARLVDFLPFFYIVGVLLITESPTKQRAGDRWAHTVVIGPPGLVLGNPPPERLPRSLRD